MILAMKLKNFKNLTIEELLKSCQEEEAAVCVSCVGNEEPSIGWNDKSN